jgi:hypothetical protein
LAQFAQSFNDLAFAVVRFSLLLEWHWDHRPSNAYDDSARLMGLRSARVTHSSELGFALSGERDLPSLTSNAHLCWLPGRRGESNRPTSVCAGSTGCRNLQAARDANHFHDCAHPPEERECCPRDPHRTLVIDPLTNMGLCLVLVQPCTTGAMFLTPLKGLSRRAVKVVLSEPRHPRRLTKPSELLGVVVSSQAHLLLWQRVTAPGHEPR